MDIVTSLLFLAVVQLLAVMSPGQSFVVISKLALASGRPVALSATLGMGVGTVIWAASAIAGLAFVLEHTAWLYGLLKLAGAAYLLVLAVRLWRNAAQTIVTEPVDGKPVSLTSGFVIGLMTQLANPKVIVFFGSIFFTLLPANPPGWVYLASILIVFFNETLWYGLVSLLFSYERPRRTYLRTKSWIDRTMAVVLGAIGARLALDAWHTVASR